MNKEASINFLREAEKTGALTDKGLEKISKSLENVKQYISKNAKFPGVLAWIPEMFQRGVGQKKVSDTVKNLALLSGALAGTQGLMRVGEKAISAATKPGIGAMHRMLDESEKLRNAPRQQVEKMWSVISDFAPSLAKNPVASAAIMENFIDFGTLDPVTLEKIIGMEKTIGDVHKIPDFRGFPSDLASKNDMVLG